MNTGVTRKVDSLGRVVIPSEIRYSMGVHDGDYLSFSVEGRSLILQKAVNQCVFCGGQRRLREFKGAFVCDSCASAIGGGAGHDSV